MSLPLSLPAGLQVGVQGKAGSRDQLAECLQFQGQWAEDRIYFTPWETREECQEGGN